MGMRKATAVLIGIIGGMLFPRASSCMQNIVSDIYGDYMNIAADTYLAAGVILVLSIAVHICAVVLCSGLRILSFWFLIYLTATV